MKKFALAVSLLFGMSAVGLYAQTTPSQQPDQSSPSMSGQQPSSTYPGASQSQQPSSSGSSSQAIADVQKALQQDSTLAQSGVSAQVGTNNNIVLTGTVQSQADKDHAEQVARSAAGGASVDNQIQVSGSSSSPSSTPSTTPPPQGNSFLPSDSAQTTSGQDQSTAGQAAPSQSTPTPTPDQSAPSTATPDQNAAGQSSAGQATGSQGSMGSQSTTGSQPSDMGSSQNAGGSAAPQIQNALQQQPNLSGVTVNETSSQIELSGNVAKSADRKAAKKIAEQYASGKKVVDNITVGDHNK